MTLQPDVRTDGRTDVGYNNIPAVSSKSAGIIKMILVVQIKQKQVYRNFYTSHQSTKGEYRFYVKLLHVPIS